MVGLGQRSDKKTDCPETERGMNGAMTIAMTRDAVWERFFLQDVIV